MTDYRTMVTGMAAMQAAAVTAAAAVTVRYAEFALREGAFVARTLLAGQPALQQVGRNIGEHSVPRLCERYIEWLREVAVLPRISALVFLGELDRIRGPRVAPGSQGTQRGSPPI